MKLAFLCLSHLSLGLVIIFGPARPSHADPSGAAPRFSAAAEDAGIVTHAGVETELRGDVVSPDGDPIAGYFWDLDGDGVAEMESAAAGTVTHAFPHPGQYTAVLEVEDGSGARHRVSAIPVVVRAGAGEPSRIPRCHLHRSDPECGRRQARAVAEDLCLSPEELEFLGIGLDAAPADAFGSGASSATPSAPRDGQRRRYAVMINGSGETRFWEDVQYGYEMFHDIGGIPDEQIFLFHAQGLSPAGDNPGGMIDGIARRERIQAGLAEVANLADGDDLVFVWVTDHGRGYIGPSQRSPSQQPFHGYLDGLASVDPGDECDYVERDFKLRALFTGGDFRGNHGMGMWRVYRYYRSGTVTYYYRHKYVSQFTDVYTIQDGLKSDSDIYIEEIKDYLVGDSNQDGIIDTALGEVADFDLDGRPPYDGQVYDEDDWGEIDLILDDVRYVNTLVPEESQSTYSILDLGMDGLLDIDLTHDPANPEANGTDLDNVGLFDGLDVNDDKDQDDCVSIDEKMCFDGGDLTDDEMADFMDGIGAQVVVIAMEQCFSGGFIEDLSRPNRAILAAAEEETVSFGNTFIRNFTSALAGKAYPGSNGNPATVDSNGDGFRDIAEVFDFSASNDPNQEEPQYDDDGDRASHGHPVAQGGEGRVGERVYLDWLSPIFVRGEANGDGDIDVSDALMIVLHLFGGMELLFPETLDADDSGVVDLSDVVFLVGYLFVGGSPPPPPFPARGIDPAG